MNEQDKDLLEHAKMLQEILGDEVEVFVVLGATSELEEEDPTPWCAGCGAMERADCDCGPIAANE